MWTYNAPPCTVRSVQICDSIAALSPLLLVLHTNGSYFLDYPRIFMKLVSHPNILEIWSFRNADWLFATFVRISKTTQHLVMCWNLTFNDVLFTFTWRSCLCRCYIWLPIYILVKKIITCFYFGEVSKQIQSIAKTFSKQFFGM